MCYWSARPIPHCVASRVFFLSLSPPSLFLRRRRFFLSAHANTRQTDEEEQTNRPPVSSSFRLPCPFIHNVVVGTVMDLFFCFLLFVDWTNDGRRESLFCIFFIDAMMILHFSLVFPAFFMISAISSPRHRLFCFLSWQSSLSSSWLSPSFRRLHLSQPLPLSYYDLFLGNDIVVGCYGSRLHSN